MQEKSEFSEFASRTDALAVHLGIRVIDLPARINISEDMLMGYRTGRYTISKKAWRKLEAAEVAAGLARLEAPTVSKETASGREITLPQPISLEEFVRRYPEKATSLIQRLIDASGDEGISIQISGYTERKKPRSKLSPAHEQAIRHVENEKKGKSENQDGESPSGMAQFGAGR